MTKRLLLCIASTLVGLAVPHAALGAGASGVVRFDQAAYVAHENQGYLTISIRRTDPIGDEWVRYGVRNKSAEDGVDFDAVPNSLAHFAPGQRTYSFRLHVYDRGMNAPPVQVMSYLFGSWPQRLGSPNSSPVTIARDDPLEVRDPANPLALPLAPADRNPVAGADFYVAGADSPAGHAEQQYANSNPAWARALSVIANAPGTRRFWFWNTPANPSGVVAHYLENAELAQPGTVVQLSTYSLPHGHCTGHWSDPQSLVARYRNWIDGLARGIGNFHVVLFFEIDSLITRGCLSAQGLHMRLVDELRWSILRLERDPHLVLYLDGGAADAVGWRETARMLREAGVSAGQGFFLNSTHFDWTTSELHYGQRVARALGGVHFVVNTGENGRGPLVPADRVHQGNEVLCNPPGRGLGPISTDTGYKWADAFLWLGNPGESGGACRPGAPPTAVYWPAYAVMLARNAVFRVTGPRYRLIRSG